MIGLGPDERRHAIAEALHIEGTALEQHAIEDAKEYERYLDRMARTESLQHTIAQAALDYQIERDQLPQPEDSKKVLRQKAMRRVGWNMAAGMPEWDAILYADQGIELGDEPGNRSFLIERYLDQVEQPALLYSPVPDAVSMLKQGWTVDYSHFALLRSQDIDMLTEQIFLEDPNVDLDIAYEVRDFEEKTLVSRGIYKVLAAKRRDGTHDLELTKQKDDAEISEEDKYFVLGLLLDATRKVKQHSPYPDVPNELRRLVRWNRIMTIPDKLIFGLGQKLFH